MARRQQLGEAQVADLFDPPTEQRELVRHYTLSEPDLAVIRRCRGDHNRLGTALMLCYLRHPGRALRAGERPPSALLGFVADQIDVVPDAFDGSAAAERSRQRHAVECQNRLSLRSFGRRAAAELTAALLAPPSRTTGSFLWRNWSCNSAVSAVSCCHRPRPWNGSVGISVIRPAVKRTVASPMACRANTANASMS